MCIVPFGVERSSLQFVGLVLMVLFLDPHGCDVDQVFCLLCIAPACGVGHVRAAHVQV